MKIEFEFDIEEFEQKAHRKYLNKHILVMFGWEERMGERKVIQILLLFPLFGYKKYIRI